MVKRVAIVGTSFRFPSTNHKNYWADLLAGADLVSQVEPNRWSQEIYLHSSKKNPGTSYTFSAGSIGDVSGFDAEFFGISPREAALMDPQQRLLMEMTWEALENGGIPPSAIRGSKCGVFIGIASADYAYRLADDLAAVDSSVATGNTSSIAANRLSYFFDLRGPSMAIDTACSSSMVAFHQACQSILSGESQQALAGGVSLHIHPYGFIVFSKATMLSRKGRCNVFDADGDGYVRSEGGGVIFLKDYDQALADGNPILAVVAGTGVNTDGRKSGLTVPSAQAQSALLEEVYARANIKPDSIDYIEAHGTGTAVGDPIETKAIGAALGMRRASPLPIGSVKSNVGHLEAASGMAGLVKAIYCIQHRQVPPTIGIKTPNPNIQFDDWNIEVVTQTTPLKKSGVVTVGINSFGFGGANAHVILQSPPTASVDQSTAIDHPTHLPLPILVSAKSANALAANAHAFADRVRNLNADEFYAMAYHSFASREWLEHRAILFASNPQVASEQLFSYSDGKEASQVVTGNAIYTTDELATANRPVFVYSGNGSQWVGMGKNLLHSSPIFLETIRAIDQIFTQYADFSIEKELANLNVVADENRFELTEIAQPALFGLQVAVTTVLRAEGLLPGAVVGHSVGEVAAAWACGALTLDDAVKVIFERSKFQGKTKGQGQMTAVAIGQEEITELLNKNNLAEHVFLAGINSDVGVTLAGQCESLNEVETLLRQKSVRFKRLDLDYAFHSPAMDGIEAGVKANLADIQPQANTTPYISTVTGSALVGTQLDATYWWNNIRQPVLFDAAIKFLLQEDFRVFVEVGPHPVLRGYVNESIKNASLAGSPMKGHVVPTLSRQADTHQAIRAALAACILCGAKFSREVFFPTAPPAIHSLPNYVWQRERHWHPVTPESLGLLDRQPKGLLGYAVPQQTWTWENRIDLVRYPTLADHVVGEDVVFPGTGFAELAIAAALQWSHHHFVEVEELEIRSPLLLSAEHAKLVQVAIDPADGTLTIRSRDYAESNAWTDHVVGRILFEANPIASASNTFFTKPNRPIDFDSERHVALTQIAGLNYGPAFKCIKSGWVADAGIMAELSIPSAIQHELKDLNLHPALLDCTFQLIIHALQEQVEAMPGVAFVPTKIGNLRFSSNGGVPTFAIANILKRSPHSLVAEFSVLDAEYQVIAQITEARFKSIRLQQNKMGEQIKLLDYKYLPKPNENIKTHASLNFEKFNGAIKDLVKRSALKSRHRRFSEEVDPLLDSLATQFLLESLNGVADQLGQISADSIQSLVLNKPLLGRVIKTTLENLSRNGLIESTQSHWQLSQDAEHISAQDIWNSLLADYPDFFELIHAVGRSGLYLSREIAGLTGHAKPLIAYQKLFRDVLGDEGKHRLAALCCQTIQQGVSNLTKGQRFHVLEISHGEALVALDCIQTINFDHTDYTFTTTSRDESVRAAVLQQEQPRICLEFLDLESEQPKVVADAHFIVMTLDFESIEQARSALDYARQRLLPGGAILLVGVHLADWLKFILQINALASERFSDDLVQAINANDWVLHLQKLGLTGASTYDLGGDNLSGIYIMAARREEADVIEQPKQLSSKNWLLLADESGYAHVVSQALSAKRLAHGDHVSIYPINALTDIRHALELEMSRTAKIDGVLLLSGLQDTTEPIVEPNIAFQAQSKRCSQAAELIQVCETLNLSTNCWLVTAGVHTTYLQQSLSSDLTNFDHALWGFGRTLLNETNEFTVKLVDWSGPADSKACALALSEELDAYDHEQEVILTAATERFVPRLQIASSEQPVTAGGNTLTQVKPSNYRLGFDFPGQLKYLRWEQFTLNPLANHEIEVAVQATGLNFRDVMYALGLLSDEAVENGFAGPSLGLEFAGVVKAIGPSVKDYAIGDRVVGFGPYSFANAVITNPSAIAHIPAGMSAEAASTIPSVFLTVFYALKQLAQIQSGEKLLIHGAAGGVGIAAIQLAKSLGAEIYATAGSDEKRDFLQLLGVTHIYDSRSLNFADEILRDTDGQGVDVVLNSLAGEAVNRNFRVLKPFGRFLELGKRDFYENNKIGLRPFRNNISYFGIDADQLMQLRPDLTKKLFSQVMQLFNEGVLNPLPFHLFDANNVVDAFRYMQQAKQIGKVVVTYHNAIHIAPRPTSPSEALTLSAHGTYLVTGGLAGFGLKTAEWLVVKGARHIALISRSGPSTDEARSAIKALTDRGVNVIAQACDVTNESALKKFLASLHADCPPLKGIVHAAVVFEDGLVRNMNPAQIERVLAPKILGAQYLHDFTKNLDLDFFVLFSSATTLFGNPGQANYVAANSWLEGFAAQRRLNGLPATCVRWGAIDDAGFLARNEKIKDALQNRMGGAALNSQVALSILEELLLSNRSGVGVLELDWRALARFLPSANSPKFSEIASLMGGHENSEGDHLDIQRLINELSPDDLLNHFINILKTEVGEILRVNPEKIDSHKSIYDMGLDSLMGVELVGALEARFGTRLSVMTLSENATIAKLAEKIISQLKGADSRSDEDGRELHQQIEQVASQHGVTASGSGLPMQQEVTEAVQNNTENTQKLIH